MPPAGGTQSAAGRLARALAGLGVSVTVVAPLHGGGSGSDVTLDGVRVVHVPDADRLATLRSLRPWRRAAVSVIRELGVDLVHGQGMLVGGLPACDVEDLPRVVTVHGNARSDTLGAYDGVGAWARVALRERLVRQVIARADTVINVHPDWRINLPAPPRQLVHVPNIVDEAYRSTDRSPEPGRVLFCGGGPRRIKGADIVFAAWPAIAASVPDATLVAVGWPDGTRPSLDGLPRETIQVRGRLSPTELADEMARAAVLVVPSRFEVAPIVLAEAWSVGTPVVAARVGGIPALGAGAALLVDPQSPPALAAAVRSLLRGDVDPEPWVREGRQRAVAHTPASVAEAHLRLYRDLVQRREHGS